MNYCLFIACMSIVSITFFHSHDIISAGITSIFTLFGYIFLTLDIQKNPAGYGLEEEKEGCVIEIAQKGEEFFRHPKELVWEYAEKFIADPTAQWVGLFRHDGVNFWDLYVTNTVNESDYSGTKDVFDDVELETIYEQIGKPLNTYHIVKVEINKVSGMIDRSSIISNISTGFYKKKGNR